MDYENYGEVSYNLLFASYIDDLEELGVNVEHIVFKYSRYIHTREFSYYNEAMREIEQLTYKYKDFISINKSFKEYKEKLPYINEKNISSLVTSIIISLSKLEKNPLFTSGYLKDFISLVCRVTYEYMKLEFLYFGESKIFNDVKDYEYSMRVIKGFAYDEVEYLKNSINYVVGTREIVLFMENNDIENVLRYLAFSSNPEKIEKLFLSKLEHFNVILKLNLRNLENLKTNVSLNELIYYRFSKKNVLKYDIEKHEKNRIISEINDVKNEYEWLKKMYFPFVSSLSKEMENIENVLSLCNF